MKHVIAVGARAVLIGGLVVSCSGDDQPGGSAGSGGGSMTAGSGGASGGSGGSTGTGGTGGASGSGGAGANGTGGATGGSGGGASGSGGAGTGGGATGGAAGSAGTGGGATGGSAGGGGSTGTAGAGGSSSDGGPRAAGGAGGSSGAGGSAAGGGGSATSDAGPATSDASPAKDAAADLGPKSLGCGKNTARPNASTQITMQVGGKTRYYLLYIPNNYAADTPMPTIFTFHGHGMNNVWAALDSGGSFQLKAATKNQAILVYPQGSGDPPGNTCAGCSTFIDSSWGDVDIPFVDALVTEIKNNYCVDNHRVFAAGFSNGAFFSNDLGCTHSDVFRAVAPVEGAGPNLGPGQSGKPSCAAAGNVGVMVIHGTGDTTVSYASGQATAEFWRTHNGCTTTTTNPSGLQGCVAYQGCKEGLPVDFCTTSSGHTVPNNGGANIWAFFNSFK